MSTILKALRRLEQEKAPTERPLREQVTQLAGDDPEDPRASRRWPILLAGIGAGVVAGIAVLWLVLSRGDATPLAVAVAPAPALADRAAGLAPALPPTTETPPPLPQAAPSPLPSVAPPPVASDDVEVIDRGLPPPRVIAPEPSAEPAVAPAPAVPSPGSVRPFQHAERRARNAPKPAAPVPTLAGEPPAPAPTLAAEPPAPAPATAAKPPAPAPATAAKPPAASPPIAAEPAPRPAPPPRAPFPALRVERTTWHPISERRLALVLVPGEGPRELREGDRVAGATVSLIEPSGVVFRFDDRDVRRKIGAGS